MGCFYQAGNYEFRIGKIDVPATLPDPIFQAVVKIEIRVPRGIHC